MIVNRSKKGPIFSVLKIPVPMCQGVFRPLDCVISFYVCFKSKGRKTPRHKGTRVFCIGDPASSKNC